MINFWEFIAQKKKEPLKVLFFGGLSTRGSRQNTLRMLGFDVISPEFPDKAITAASGKVATGKGVIPSAFKKLFGGKVDKYWNQLIDIANTATMGYEPDLIIGSSQGGAIAMEISRRYPEAKLILLAPAWRIYNVSPIVKSSTTIIHGRKDKIVPFKDSVELAKINGCDLVATNEGHKLDAATIIMIKKAKEVAKNLGKWEEPKPVDSKTISAPEKPQLPRPGSPAWQSHFPPQEMPPPQG
jgi:hypothetical protein